MEEGGRLRLDLEEGVILVGRGHGGEKLLE
jgi:hypothetical protein